MPRLPRKVKKTIFYRRQTAREARFYRRYVRWFAALGEGGTHE